MFCCIIFALFSLKNIFMFADNMPVMQKKKVKKKRNNIIKAQQGVIQIAYLEILIIGLI